MDSVIVRLWTACAMFVVGLAASVRAAEPWVSGYYPGWEQQTVPPAKVPFEAVTHLMHFSCLIGPDGTLDTRAHMLSDEHIRQTIAAARTAKKRVLVVLGGADSGAGFRAATADGVRDKLIANVIAFVRRHGYDGVDIDWEPIQKDEFDQYRKFVHGLRTGLRRHDSQALLTTAVGHVHGDDAIEKLHAELQEEFDQINVMTYVLAGAWPGWVTWHGSALANGGAMFGNGRPMPSIENSMQPFVKAGVRKDKLGIGLAFHGSVWKGGVTQPKQSWTTPPTVEPDVAYRDVMQRYQKQAKFEYDAETENAWLSVDVPGEADDCFISYTDARGIIARLNFMQREGYGGCIVWNIAQDTMPDGQQPLSKAIAGFREPK